MWARLFPVRMKAARKHSLVARQAPISCCAFAASDHVTAAPPISSWERPTWRAPGLRRSGPAGSLRLALLMTLRARQGEPRRHLLTSTRYATGGGEAQRDGREIVQLTQSAQGAAGSLGWHGFSVAGATGWRWLRGPSGRSSQPVQEHIGYCRPDGGAEQQARDPNKCSGISWHRCL